MIFFKFFIDADRLALVVLDLDSLFADSSAVFTLSHSVSSISTL